MMYMEGILQYLWKNNEKMSNIIKHESNMILINQKHQSQFTFNSLEVKEVSIFSWSSGSITKAKTHQFLIEVDF